MSTTSPADEDKSGAEINITPNIKLESYLQDDTATGGSEPGLDKKSLTYREKKKKSAYILSISRGRRGIERQPPRTSACCVLLLTRAVVVVVLGIARTMRRAGRELGRRGRHSAEQHGSIAAFAFQLVGLPISMSFRFTSARPEQPLVHRHMAIPQSHE
jgi:hypothetical protein